MDEREYIEAAPIPLMFSLLAHRSDRGVGI